MHIEKYKEHKANMEHKMYHALSKIIHEFEQVTGYTPHSITVEIQKHTMKDHEYPYGETHFWAVERVKTEVKL